MKVLVAIDNSPSKETILEAVVNRSWPARTTFCVFERREPATLRKTSRPHRRRDARRRTPRARGRKENLRCRLRGISTNESRASAFRNLVLCQGVGADLIVVGSHGHGAVGRFLLGSVAQGVLRTAPCSVEIVRTALRVSSPRKVLLATDGSDCSVGAAHAVAAQLWPPGSVFKVLSVKELITAGNQMEGASLSSVYPASLLEELMTEARARADSAIDVAKDILTRAGLTLDSGDSVPLGEPRSVILDTAKHWGADLIIVGSHGRRGLDRFLLGSVSEAVAIHATRSVQVVRRRQNAKDNRHAN
jgi:nucleotide-binding universal stress UspA family protein